MKIIYNCKANGWMWPNASCMHAGVRLLDNPRHELRLFQSSDCICSYSTISCCNHLPTRYTDLKSRADADGLEAMQSLNLNQAYISKHVEAGSLMQHPALRCQGSVGHLFVPPVALLCPANHPWRRLRYTMLLVPPHPDTTGVNA